MKTFYKIDENRFFIFSTDAEQIPFSSVEVSPPNLKENQVVMWETELPVAHLDFGTKGSGKWVVKTDNRNIELFLTSDGSKYTIGSETENGSYDGFNDIPKWLTTLPSPGIYYVWKNGAWVLDEDKKREADEQSERQWRDSQINSIGWMRDRHRDQLDAGIETTLSTEQFAGLLVYTQALRDWPANPDFPNSEKRPVAPDFI